MKPTTLVLLPGLDGTDVFFRPLIAALPASIRVRVVAFPDAGPNGYPALLAHVRRQLEDVAEFWVLGSSFSGPLALMLAAAEPGRTRGVVLAATFVRVPRPELRKWKAVATGPVIWTIRTVRRLPVWLLRRRTDPFRVAKAETWARVSATALAARVRAVLGVDAREQLAALRRPLLCIAAADDTVVPGHNLDDIVRIRPADVVVTLPGTHLVLFHHPQAAADAIAAFIAGHR